MNSPRFKYLSLLMCFAIIVGGGSPLFAQCGNLGENIFEDGDFGSGSANVVLTDPGIAPGFIYQPSPPPQDGLYTITNNTGGPGWGNIFTSWARFQDNSPDPNGYMMVVNANFSRGNFYEQQVDGLCENTEYQFAVDVRNMLLPGPPGLFPDVAFVIDGVVRDSTGDIPQDNRWRTYDLNFRTGPGQTSVLLTLRNNNAGGNGNDLAIDNISFRACGPDARIEGATTTVEACAGGDPSTLVAEIIGDQYSDPAVQWQRSPDLGVTWEDLPGETDLTYTTPALAEGQFYFRYLLAASPSNIANGKCRVTSNIKIVNVEPVAFTVVDTICSGLSVEVGNSTYSATGIYQDSFLTALGCDSIVTTDLTVVPDPGLVPDFAIVDSRCSDAEEGSVALAGVANSNGAYTFTLDGAVRDSVVGSLAPGVYDYSIEDRFGCAVAGAVEVGSPAPFVVDLGPDREVELGDEVRVSVNSNYGISGYDYYPPVPGCEPICDEILLLPTNTLHLRLSAQSDTGCVAVDSVLITVIKNRDVFLPNSFSPNGDGVNDNFTLFSKESRIAGVTYLRVFDRWGALVFEAEGLPANETRFGWNGRVGEEEAPIGTYIYSIEVVYPDGETRQFGGTVMLVR